MRMKTRLPRFWCFWWEDINSRVEDSVRGLHSLGLIQDSVVVKEKINIAGCDKKEILVNDKRLTGLLHWVNREELLQQRAWKKVALTKILKILSCTPSFSNPKRMEALVEETKPGPAETVKGSDMKCRPRMLCRDSLMKWWAVGQ